MYEEELKKLMKDLISNWRRKSSLERVPIILIECAICEALFESAKEYEYDTHIMFPFTRYQYDHMRKKIEEWYSDLRKEFHSKERLGELSYAAEKICDMLMERN